MHTIITPHCWFIQSFPT